MWDWLDTHQAAMVAAASAVLALTALLLALALWRALRQGRRALLGAVPVPRPPRLRAGDAGDGGGLRVEIPLVNMAVWPATDLRVRARLEGRDLGGGVEGGTLFGVSADGSTTEGVRAVFTWPVGVLDGRLEVRWSWRDGAGRHEARWSGEMRVPQPAMPGTAGGGPAG